LADLTDAAYWDTAILRAAGRLLMLAAIGDRPGHGYDIARRLTSVCGDWCKPSSAMIYPAIHELESEGLIACQLETVGGRKRRVCSLTEEGKQALKTGYEAWARFLPTMQELLARQGIAPPPGGSCCGQP
jgi:DNA-binding PadR family transcriptional regulator